MKFQTIVLTKRKLTAAAAIAAATAAGLTAAAVFIPFHTKSIEVFKLNSDVYEGILQSGLPAYEGKKSGIKNIAARIFGIDTDNPENIIKEYSAAFEAADTGDYAPENNPELTEIAEAEPENSNPAELPALPEHDAICSSVGLKINNATNYDINIDEMCGGEISIRQEGDEPLVLVMHTHTTECYLGDEMSGETERTTDESRNVIAVGNEICNVLESYGIKTLHDTTYHDYPSYQGSYTRALSTIEGLLAEYPSVKAVLDIHRDAFVYSDGSRLAVRCEQNGISTAQVMLVVGTDSMGLWHDNWRDNLTFAAKIQNAAEIMYPGLMRPVNLRTERFNGHTTRGSLILEVGSNGNTFEEAIEGGHDVAAAIAAAILNG